VRRDLVFNLAHGALAKAKVKPPRTFKKQRLRMKWRGKRAVLTTAPIILIVCIALATALLAGSEQNWTKEYSLRVGDSVRNAAKITGKGVSTVQRIKLAIAA
jgi:hypothetical protein